MHEFVYVLTVEAAVFGFVGVVLVAQRINVLQWSSSESLPVFSSSLVFIFAYVQLLLLLCCAIAVGKFGILTYGVMDACARSAGRLSTGAVLSGCYVAGLLVISNASEPALLSCFLAQLLGTSCMKVSPVILSYSVYLAVLVPVWALVAGLQITAAGLCKDKDTSSRARLLCVNIAFVLTYHVNNSLQNNIACRTMCGAQSSEQQEKFVQSIDLLYLMISLCLTDIIAECVLNLTVIRPLSFLGPPGEADTLHSRSVNFSMSGVTTFSLLHITQVGALVLFWWMQSQQLPLQLVIVHSVLASCACLLDIFQVLHDREVTESMQKLQQQKQKSTLKTPKVLDLQPSAIEPRLKAFEVEPSTRRKFNMNFSSRSRWPSAVDDVPAQKKTT